MDTNAWEQRKGIFRDAFNFWEEFADTDLPRNEEYYQRAADWMEEAAAKHNCKLFDKIIMSCYEELGGVK